MRSLSRSARPAQGRCRGVSGSGCGDVGRSGRDGWDGRRVSMSLGCAMRASAPCWRGICLRFSGKQSLGAIGSRCDGCPSAHRQDCGSIPSQAGHEGQEGALEATPDPTAPGAAAPGRGRPAKSSMPPAPTPCAGTRPAATTSPRATEVNGREVCTVDQIRARTTRPRGRRRSLRG